VVEEYRNLSSTIL